MMSKSVASESNEGYESPKTGGKRGVEYEGNGNEEGILEVPWAESLQILTVVSTVPATTDQFMFTPDFRRHFVEFVPGDTLMTLRLATKGWKAAADAFIDEGVRSGELIVHDGRDFSYEDAEARYKRCALATWVVFLLDITQIGVYACVHAANLIIVDIPEGFVSIGMQAFMNCRSLTTVSFPTTLVGEGAFACCSSLDNVDLLHTNLQELGTWAFEGRSELKSMTILDSLQTLGFHIFAGCSKLVP